MRFHCKSFAFLFFALCPAALDAGIAAIDSVTLGPSNELVTATVGGTGYSAGVIADYGESGPDGQFASPVVGAKVPQGAEMTSGSVEQGKAFDNDVLTGVGGGAGGSRTGSGGMLALYWNSGPGGITDNDADPDFFVFEDGGNDSVSVHAILADNTLGAAVGISTWNLVRSDGVLSAPALSARNVAGGSFSLTDLLDASGTPLTNGTPINGILIGDPGAADFYEVYAHVDTVDYNPAVQVSATSPERVFAFPVIAEGGSASRTVRYEVVASDGASVIFQNLGLTDDPAHPSGAFAVASDPAMPVTLGDGESIDITVTADSSTSGAFAGSLFIDTSSVGGSMPADQWDLTLPLTSAVSAPPTRISGVYPHLAVTSSHSEVGIGAIVPWADRLWAITYGPHLPTGDSTNKLYEIDDQLNRLTRPESIGGTPANRFIHEPSNQLIIGNHFVDPSRNVRTLPYSSAPGRPTGTAAHLTDPDNRVYLFTMEDGVYDVNVHDLSFITRYPDVQLKGDKFMFGMHGKGAYTGQGSFIAANNGRPSSQGTPLGPAGVLARWDGTTYGDLGGSYLPLPPINNDPSYEVDLGPASGQSDYIAGWTHDFTVQHCEVTGPGGISGNPNPDTDPVWATGFDAKSVMVRVLEDGTWSSWRLPKASYSHDGSHGWHTEWPRIRQLDPDTPGSPYLMHMHGLFFDFPKTFSSSDFSGLEPICNYFKMPVDYCMFNGQLVIAKNDLSKFDNSLALRAQSNLWFGQLEDLSNWGAPQGHGGVWLNDSVASGETSEPFLVNGFSRITLHLRNGGSSAVPVTIESSNGSGSWSTMTRIDVPANGYTFEILNDLPAEWLRLRPNAAASDLTAYFLLSNPYPHAPVASVGGDRFAALADVRDTTGYSDGIIRPMSGDDLRLEFASDDGYHRIGEALALQDVNNASAESNLRSRGALNKAFGGDAASVWVTSGSTRLRLPKLDPLYDSPFLSGWPRGFREVVTERSLLNCHGTFYEVPRDNSGGRYKMRPLATHGKRITDFSSWRGLLVLSGVLDDAPASTSLVRSPSVAALWLGEVDDIWQMGEPRGTGGPWKDSAVTANQPSDPYLMYGYDRKELTLSAADAATLTVEVDFLADGTWSTYQTFTLSAGETLNHVFPEGFHAHWVRVTSDTGTTATAQFTYGPVDQRDTLLDWGRNEDSRGGFEGVKRKI